MIGNGARRAGWAVGLVLFALGMGLHAITGHGYGAIIAGVVVIGSVVLERRYQRQIDPGDLLADRWRPTGERFVDSESGEPMEVLTDALTGERRYVRLGHPIAKARRPDIG